MTITALRPSAVPKTEWMLITPELAEFYLRETNNGNRNLSQSVVNRYAQDMSSGLWRNPTGEPLIWDSNGRLQQGQHRLAAVAQSKTPIRFLVITGADPGDFQVLDQGKKRSAADILGMAGFQNTTNCAATARLSMMLEYYRDKPWANLPEVTQQRVVEFAKAHKSTIEWANAHGRRARRNALVPEVQFGAVAFYVAQHSAELNDWETFSSRVCSGEMLREGDPEHSLRRWTVNRNLKLSGSTSSQAAVAVITKAWNAYVTGKNIKVLGWKRHEMPMPEPHPSS
jgi:hypothetical protein